MPIKDTLYTPIHPSVPKTFAQQMKMNRERLDYFDEKAKKAGKLVGRYIQEQYADSHAVYQIVKENKTTVVIAVCKGIGDGWTIPYWGERATIDKKYAVENVDYRDRVNSFLQKGSNHES